MNLVILRFVLFLSLGSAALAQTVSAPDQTSITSWGPGGSVAYGETVTVPGGANSLQSFTFTSVNSINSQSFNYQAYLYAFNTTTNTLVGPALYTSAVQTVPASGSVSIVLTPTTAQLTTGNVYMVFVSSNGVAQTNANAAGGMEGTNFGNPTYSGGYFYYTDDTTGLATDIWTNTLNDNAAFTAVFGNAVFGLVGYNSSLTPNEFRIGAPINAGVFAGNANANFANLVTALQAQPSLGPALDQLSPLAFGQFTTTTAFNNASFAAELMDNYFATRRGPNGTFIASAGGIDTSGLTINSPSVDPLLSQIHSHLLAWNGEANPAIMSDVAEPVLGGVETTDVKDLDSKYRQSNANRWNVFLQGNVVLAQGLSQGGVPHYDSNTSSVVAGADYQFTPHFLAGAKLAYGHTDATLDDAGSSTTVDSYSPGIYASYVDGGWYANGTADYVRNAYTEDRVVSFLGETAHGAPSGNEATAQFDGGYDFHVQNWTLGPTLGLEYTHLVVNSYDEDGAPLADLSVAQNDADSLRSKFGGRVSYALHSGGITFTPHLDASWQHEFLDQSRGLTSQFDGLGVGSFAVQTPRASRDSALLDIGLDADLNRTATVFADYAVQAGQNNYFGQELEGGVRIGF